MKRSITILITVVLCTIRISAQTVTAGELLAHVKCRTFGCANDFIIKKGFSFKQRQDADHLTMYNYESDAVFRATGSSQVETPNAFIYGISVKSRDTMTMVGFHTAVKEQYTNLVSGLKEFGFTPADEPVQAHTGDGIKQNFTSKKYPGVTMAIFTRIDADNSKNPYTFYEIFLKKN